MEGYKDNSGFNAVFGSGGGGSSPTINRDFASAYSDQTQTTTAPLSANQVQLEIASLQSGVSISPSGVISFTNQGFYMIEATLQFYHNSPTTPDEALVWLYQNGVAVPQTTRTIVLNSNITKNLISVSYLVAIVPSPIVLPTISIGWSVSSTNISLTAFTGGTSYPANPSAICNVFQIA
jgi:hypothetical protein